MPDPSAPVQAPAKRVALPTGWFPVLAAGTVLGWLIFQLGGMTGHIFNATRFILYDQGSYLYAVGRWQAGEALYRDFAWQYGPLALGWYRAFAAFGGNAPLTLVLAGAAAFAAAWMIIAHLLLRAAGRCWGGILAVAGLLPLLSAVGLNALNGPHGAVEMLLLAVIAWTLSLRPAAWPRAAWGLGLLVGLLQWVRFGPHLIAFAAILLIAGWQRKPAETNGRAWARSVAAFGARVLAGYAACLAPLACWLFLTLPAAGAREQLWPTHMVAHYAATYPHRWPQIASINEGGVVWLPALLGVALAVTVLIAGGKNHAGRAQEPVEDGATAGLIFFPLYYLLGCVGLFHNDYAFTGHLWLAWPGLALAPRLPRGWMRVGVALAITPALLATGRGLWTAHEEELAWHARPLVLPNGQSLWFRPAEAERFGRLQEALRPAPQPRRVAVLLAGGGIHHFFGTQRVGRHWWFLPEFVRPWETETVRQALLRHELVLVADMGQTTNAPAAPGVLSLWLPLPSPLAAQLLPHLKNPRHLPGVGDLLDMQP